MQVDQEGIAGHAHRAELLATRHALDSTYVRLNLSVAEQELAVGRCDSGVSPQAVVEVLDRLQTRLGRSR